MEARSHTPPISASLTDRVPPNGQGKVATRNHYGTFRRLLTKGMGLHGKALRRYWLTRTWKLTLFNLMVPAEQLASWCVGLIGWCVNRHPESKSVVEVSLQT
jgi:hypothetical protein